MSENYTTPEEYRTIREECIVKEIYGGRDNLPMETKEQLLSNVLGGQSNFHCTRLNSLGETEGTGHVEFHQKVSILEFELLNKRGLIKVKLF